MLLGLVGGGILLPLAIASWYMLSTKKYTGARGAAALGRSAGPRCRLYLRRRAVPGLAPGPGHGHLPPCPASQPATAPPSTPPSPPHPAQAPTASWRRRCTSSQRPSPSGVSRSRRWGAQGRAGLGRQEGGTGAAWALLWCLQWCCSALRCCCWGATAAGWLLPLLLLGCCCWRRSGHGSYAWQHFIVAVTPHELRRSTLPRAKQDCFVLRRCQSAPAPVPPGTWTHPAPCMQHVEGCLQHQVPAMPQHKERLQRRPCAPA
jgi:hypothetical protein